MTVAEVNAVAQAFHDGVANRDAGALANSTPMGEFLPPGMEPCEGREEIEAAMQQLLDWVLARWTSSRSTFVKQGMSRSSMAGTRWASSPRARNR